MPRTMTTEREQRLAKIERWLAEGIAQAEMARRLGISRTQVRKDVAVLNSRNGRAPSMTAVTSRASGKSKDRPVHFTGGRLTRDTDSSWHNAFRTIIPPPDFDQQWEIINIDRQTLKRSTPAQLSKILLNLSPEISRGLWDYMLMLNPGQEITAMKPGTEDPDKAAQVVLDDFLAEIDERYGARDVLFARTNMGAITRGAFFNELVLDETASRPLTIVAPDPYSVRFRKYTDPVEGERWEMGQWQAMQFAPLDRPTIRYVPIHPEPGSPYGRPMLTPALFPALFLLGLFYDLRRVIAQQGYPRLDISVLMEPLRAMFSATDEDEMQEKVSEIVSQISKEYAAMEPDDAYVHTDVISVNRPVGTIDSSSLRGADAIIAALERLTTRAAKTMPLLMGLAEGTSEANANRQWEIFSKGVKTLQHLHEQMLGSLLTIALEVQGVPATVKVAFAELRASEEQRDELTFKGRLENAEKAKDLGFWDQDQASMHAVGEPPFKTQDEVDAEREKMAEQIASGGDEQQPDDLKPDPSEDRQLRPAFTRAEDDDVPPLDIEIEFTDEDIRKAIASFEAAVDAEWKGLLDAEIEE